LGQNRRGAPAAALRQRARPVDRQERDRMVVDEDGPARSLRAEIGGGSLWRGRPACRGEKDRPSSRRDQPHPPNPVACKCRNQKHHTERGEGEKIIWLNSLARMASEAWPANTRSTGRRSSGSVIRWRLN